MREKGEVGVDVLQHRFFYACRQLVPREVDSDKCAGLLILSEMMKQKGNFEPFYYILLDDDPNQTSSKKGELKSTVLVSYR